MYIWNGYPADRGRAGRTFVLLCVRLILQWQCVDLRSLVEYMAGTAGCGVVLNEQGVRLYALLCVSLNLELLLMFLYSMGL